MKLQDIRERHWYEKMIREEAYDDDREKLIISSSSTSLRRRCFWVKKMNGKKIIKGVKISRCRRVVNWKRFSWVVFPRKISRIYSHFVKRLIELDGNSVIFATTWGIPVLSNRLTC